jgi:hypothetical protein
MRSNIAFVTGCNLPLPVGLLRCRLAGRSCGRSMGMPDARTEREPVELYLCATSGALVSFGLETVVLSARIAC